MTCCVLKAVLFDFNGVLVDDEPLHCRLICDLAEERAGLSVTRDTYFRRYTGIPDRECFTSVWRDGGLSPPGPAELEDLVAEKARRYHENVMGQDLFFPGAADLVRRAAALVPVGIVSGALREEVWMALRQAKLESVVSVVVTAEDVPRGKPAPDPYLTALRALGDRARRNGAAEPTAAVTLAVEDTEPGVTAARAAGLRVLSVGHTTPRERLAAADLFVPRIADVDLDDVQRKLAERSTSS